MPHDSIDELIGSDQHDELIDYRGGGSSMWFINMLRWRQSDDRLFDFALAEQQVTIARCDSAVAADDPEFSVMENLARIHYLFN